MSLDASERFVVRELHGYPTDRAKRSGMSIWVADEAYNGKVMKIWRSEDSGGNRYRAFAKLRAKAAAHAQELNREACAQHTNTR